VSRSVPEWIGKTDDSKPPRAVRARVLLAYEGRCYLSGRKITAADQWDLDHVKALCNGGENREANLAPAIRAAHRAKTASDVAEKAKVNRIRDKHLGIVRPKGFGRRSRKFNGEVSETARARREGSDQ